MYAGPGIGRGVAGAVGGGGALAATGVGQTEIFIVLALALLVVGALLLRSSSLKHRKGRDAPERDAGVDGTPAAVSLIPRSSRGKRR